MTAAYDRLLDRLRDQGHQVNVTGNGQAKAQCPAHDDSKPSLSVTRLEQRTLVYCHAGCETVAVLTALELGLSDLYDEPRGARYDYLDTAGQVVRTVHRTPDKRFRQSGDTKARPALYRLPEVVAAVASGTTIYLVEGEQDVHALETLGAIATTAPMGAGNWSKVDTSPLHGAHVVAVPDADAAGTNWSQAVHASLTGHAASLTWARAAVGKDAADHVAAGHGLAELVPIETPVAAAGESRRRLVLTSADTISPRRVRWLWDGRVALGTLALLAGREGVGKSTVAYWLAARVTRGELPGEYQGEPRAALICATEDSWTHTIVPRLMAAGADLGRIHLMEVVADTVHVGLSLPRDVPDVERAAAEVGAGLLLLDPLMSRLDAGLDSHRDHEVRQALEPLARLADQASVAVVGLIHHNKSTSTDPLQLVMGSRAFSAVARSVSTVIPDPDDDTNTRRLFGTPKNNLGRTDLPTLAFRVESHPIETDDGTAWTGRVEWGDDSPVTIGEAMRRAVGDAREDQGAATECADWLRDHLTGQGGCAESGPTKRAARSAGHSEWALRRARERLSIVTESQGFPRVTTWSLPESLPSREASREESLGETLSTNTTTTTEGIKSSRGGRVGGEDTPRATTSPLTDQPETLTYDWNQRHQTSTQ